jgi:hypothetical protein
MSTSASASHRKSMLGTRGVGKQPGTSAKYGCWLLAWRAQRNRESGSGESTIEDTSGASFSKRVPLVLARGAGLYCARGCYSALDADDIFSSEPIAPSRNALLAGRT